MRIRKLPISAVGLCAALLASTACQTAQRPATLLPANATAPPAHNTPSPTPSQPVAQADPVTMPLQNQITPDPIPELITRVEKEYEAGQENYKAGHLEAAK